MATWRNPFATPPAQPAAPQGGQHTTPQGGQQTTVLPPTNGGGQAPQTPQDPLAAFEKLFYNEENPNSPKAPEFKLTPDAIKQAADSLDFSDSVPQDIMDRLDKRDPTAFKDLVNALGRKLYSTNLEHNSILTDRFVGARSEYDRKGYGEQVNKTLARNSLKSVAEKSPVAAAHLQRIADDLYSKNPDASPEWIEEQTKRFFLDMARTVNPEAFAQGPGSSNGTQGTSQETDWDDFFGDKRTK